MTAETSENVTKTFKFSYPTCTAEEVLFNLEVPVQIPYDGCTRELVQRVINMFHIPVYLEEELNEELAKFVSVETQKHDNERDKLLINNMKTGVTDIDGIVRSWEKLYKEQITEYAEQKGTSDEDVFAAAYHRLVHSPALETILQVENSYASTVNHTLKNREQDVKNLTQRQTEEMEEKVRLLNRLTTEYDINELASKHFEEQSLVLGRWGSQVDALCQTQRTQYRAWLMQTLEEQQTNCALNTPSNSPLGTFGLSTSFPPLPPVQPSARTSRLLEESFTIHLGSQLKQMHNVRIVATDMLKLCEVEQLDNATDTSRRLQTALGLYSSELCGVVLLSESPPSRPSGHTQDLIRICQASTEFHFPSIEDQMQKIVEDIKKPVEKRNAQRFKEQSEATYGDGQPARRVREGKNLQTGDIFVTRHSNLAEAHVVFHMLADDSSLRSGDINSRHPAILGLRNILKTACCNDITTISLPVLLRHHMSDEMTVAWCGRRAELVLKCVKGFMIEMAGWGGARLKNIQFVVPEGISEELFQALAATLPTIFRISNPLYFQARQ